MEEFIDYLGHSSPNLFTISTLLVVLTESKGTQTKKTYQMQHKTLIDFRDREPVQHDDYEEAVVYCIGNS